MTTRAHECLMRMYHEEHSLEDYQGSIPRWCNGCGDNAILTAVQRLCRDEKLKPEKTVVYICGNPEMILNAEAVLMDRGFPEFHVKKELYWPKGKQAGAPAAG